MILLIGISNLLVIYIGGTQYINGEIQFGTIIEFMLYVNILTWPVAVVGWVTSMVQQAEASQARINEFLKEIPEIQNANITPSELKGNVTFKNVTFTYDDTNITALKNINFSVKPGETLAILGKTGSGKSTIIELISRLYDTKTGTILLDDIPIEQVNLDAVRSQIGFVPQDPFLFSETIEETIKFGKENATKEEIITAAQNADIPDNIINFPKGYKTILGERGVTLSGGQKQRVGIARAFAGGARIVVADEPVSALDVSVQAAVTDLLMEIQRKEKTTLLFISHDLSIVRYLSDRVMVMYLGHVVELGTTDQVFSPPYHPYTDDTVEKRLCLLYTSPSPRD